MNRVKSLAAVLLLTLGVCAFGGAARADRFSDDPVEALRKALTGEDPEKVAPAAAKVRGAADLTRALLLREWGLGSGALGAWNQLSDRFFKEEALRVLKQGDPGAASALCARLVEMAEAVSKNQLSRPFTLLEARLAALFEPLSALNRSPDPQVRRAAILAAARLHADGAKLLPWMEGMLRDPDAIVRRAAAGALATIIDQAAVAESRGVPYTSSDLVADKDLRAAVLSLVPSKNLISGAVRLAGRALTDSDAEVRRLALEALEQGTLPLIEAAGDPSEFFLPEEDAAAAKELTEFKKSYDRFLEARKVERLRLLPEILAAQCEAIGVTLNDPAYTVKKQARETVEALARARNHPREADPDELPKPKPLDNNKTAAPGRGDILLVSAQAKKDEKERPPGPITVALRRILPALIQGMSDPIPELRMLAAEAIDEMETDALTPEVVQALAAALSDRALLVRWVAARALGDMARIVWDKDAANKAEQLALLAQAVPGLNRLVLEETDVDVRGAVCVAIQNYGPAARDTVPALAKSVNVGDAEVREAAVRALEGIGTDSASAIPDLIRALEPKRGYLDIGGPYVSGNRVRKAAAELLGKFGPAARDAVPALRQSLESPDEEIRRAAADALLQITSPPSGK